MIPLYGFLEGDTLGLLLLAEPESTIAALAQQLRAAARLRADPGEPSRVFYRGRELDPALTVAAAGLTALQRFDVRGPAGVPMERS